MATQNENQAMDEVILLLKWIETMPIELCKEAYDWVDSSVPGYLMDHLQAAAVRLKSTREITLEDLPGMERHDYPLTHWFKLILATEYMVWMATE